MNYLSTFELAAKWEITPRRVLDLIKSGRIPEAKWVGSRWMIPENTEKPADGRTKTGKTEQQTEADAFRYPIFEFRDATSFHPPLSQEELTVKAVIEAVNAFLFTDAKMLLGDLHERTQNRYIRITALYCGCMIGIFLHDISLFLDRYGKLKVEMQEDFPYKTEMSEYIHEVDAALGLDAYYSDEFHIKPAYTYHESFLPRLCNLSALWLTFGRKQITPSDITPHEINCTFLENTDYYFDLQALHVYLACAYGITGQKDACRYHLHRALVLAQKYDLFFTFSSMQYYILPEAFDDALRAFPDAFKNKIMRCNEYAHQCYVWLTNALQINSLYKLLNNNDYIYIVFAMQNLTNKETAKKMHISVSEVNKHYSKIYTMLGVNNKKELIALYHSLSDISVDGK